MTVQNVNPRVRDRTANRNDPLISLIDLASSYKVAHTVVSVGPYRLINRMAGSVLRNHDLRLHVKSLAAEITCQTESGCAEDTQFRHAPIAAREGTACMVDDSS